MTTAPSPIELMRCEATHYEETPDEVSGYWRGHYVWVERKDEDGLWYIRVNHPDGGYLYDGWWRAHRDVDASDAVVEAFRGAELLEAGQ
ncbi:hypothetical protein PQQ84_05630 [Paraburkholderia strydomiana]|uniref:hypothetical protein n=1 Tax=Paraburkholderia strydomiana TaxID=1245417 RepID=UPI0038B87E5D